MTRVALLLLAACGTPAATTTTTAPQKPTSDRMPEGPPLVTPGERMSYRLQLQGMELASYDFVVGQPVEVSGKQTIPIQSHAKAVGLVQMVAKVDDYFTSWVDVATGRPVRWNTDEFATKGSDKERTDARFSERANDVVPVDFHLNDDAPKPEPQKVSLADVWDLNSFLIALRVWDAPPGTSISAEVFRSRFLWHVDVKLKGKDKLVTALGELPATRIEAHLYKLGRDGTRAPDSAERDFSVWISGDDGRVPLLTVAKTDYGDIRLEITDYQPGTGQRLRD